MVIATDVNLPPIKGVQIPFQTEEEWLGYRRMGLGSTDAGAALGISKYKTPYQLWEEKTGLREGFAGNNRTLRGKALEPLIAEHYVQQNNVTVYAVNTLYRHLLHPFILASIDRLVFDPLRGWGLVECKSTDSWVYESWDMESFGFLRNGVVSNEHYAQAMAQLMVTGLDWVDIHILIVDVWEYRTFTVRRNDVAIEAMEHDLALWWHQHIDAGIPPEKTAIDWEETKPTEGSVAAIADGDAEKFTAYFAMKAELKALSDRVDAAKDELALTIKDAETVIYGDAPVATWKQQARETVSVEAVRERLGEDANDLIKRSVFRVLRQVKSKGKK